MSENLLKAVELNDSGTMEAGNIAKIQTVRSTDTLLSNRDVQKLCTHHVNTKTTITKQDV